MKNVNDSESRSYRCFLSDGTAILLHPSRYSKNRPLAEDGGSEGRKERLKES
jgi:hypothetical protein